MLFRSFDFVTAGMSLDKDALKAVWEGYKSQEQRNSTNPAYSLLEKLMHSQWNMSNEEMVDAVIQLAQYVEEGKFCDNMAYVNSATYLQHFCSLTSLSQKDMQTKIVSGIDKMYANVSSLSLLDKMNLDVLENDIPKESRWVVEYERKKMDEIAHSINTITTVVADGAAGVNNAAISTQDLVEDIVNISNKMIENKSIAQNLKNSTNIFAKF